MSSYNPPINTDLSVFSFRNNNGVAEYSMDGGTTWQKVGGGMKCKKSGVVTFTSGQDAKTTVNIASLGLSSVEDYMVITSGDGYDYQGAAYNGSIGYVDNKTATSFDICTSGYISALSGIKVSYQVIVFD